MKSLPVTGSSKGEDPIKTIIYVCLKHLMKVDLNGRGVGQKSRKTERQQVLMSCNKESCIVCMSVCLFFCLSVFLSLCPSVSLSFCLSLCLSVCLSISLCCLLVMLSQTKFLDSKAKAHIKICEQVKNDRGVRGIKRKDKSLSFLEVVQPCCITPDHLCLCVSLLIASLLNQFRIIYLSYSLPAWKCMV